MCAYVFMSICMHTHLIQIDVYLCGFHISMQELQSLTTILSLCPQQIHQEYRASSGDTPSASLLLSVSTDLRRGRWQPCRPLSPPLNTTSVSVATFTLLENYYWGDSSLPTAGQHGCFREFLGLQNLHLIKLEQVVLLCSVDLWTFVSGTG